MTSRLRLAGTIVALVALTRSTKAQAQPPGQAPDVPRPAAPVVVTAVSPIYPAIAIQAEVQSSIVADVKVGADGVPTSVLQTPRVPLLEEAVQAAARGWRFAAREAPHSVQLTFVYRIEREPQNLTMPSAYAVFSLPYKVEIRGRPVPTQDPVVRKKR